MVQPQSIPGAAGMPAAAARNQALAQAIYLAQISACKGNCQCNTCKIIRKASDAMISQFLTGGPPVPESDVVDLAAQITDQGSSDS